MPFQVQRSSSHNISGDLHNRRRQQQQEALPAADSSSTAGLMENSSSSSRYYPSDFGAMLKKSRSFKPKQNEGVEAIYQGRDFPPMDDLSTDSLRQNNNKFRGRQLFQCLVPSVSSNHNNHSKERETIIRPKTKQHHVHPVLTATSSDDSRMERFDKAFDYAFDADIWAVNKGMMNDNSLVETSRVDTTFASNFSSSDSASSSSSSSAHPDPVTLNSIGDKQRNEEEDKKIPKWKRLLLFGKMPRRSKSLDSAPKNSPDRQLPQPSDWPDTSFLDTTIVHDEDGFQRTDAAAFEREVELEYKGRGGAANASHHQDWLEREQSSFSLIGLDIEDDDNNFGPRETGAVEQNHDSGGVMELGQYAREMQSKSRSNSPLRKSQSLFCALPGLGKKRSGDDFPDPEIVDHDSEDDSNSYLAVSYNEECAQLVMQHSDEQLNPDMALLEQKLLEQRFIETLGQEDPPGSTKEERDYDLAPDISPNPYVGMEDDGYTNDNNDDSSTFNKDDCLDEEDIIDDLMQLAAERRTTNLGASYPHPAAKARDDFVLQMTAHRRLRHPSPFDGDDDKSSQRPSSETPNSCAKLEMKAESVQRSHTSSPGQLQTSNFPKSRSAPAEKEKHGNITFHHYNTAKLSDTPPVAERPSAASGTPALIQKIDANLRAAAQMKPWILTRRDDPVVPEDEAEADTKQDQQLGLSCPTPAPYPSMNCAELQIESQPVETDWENKAIQPILGSRTVSTLSHPTVLQERRTTSADFWELSKPIRTFASEMNQTLCENIYIPEQQPDVIPFDEIEEDWPRPRRRRSRSKRRDPSHRRRRESVEEEKEKIRENPRREKDEKIRENPRREHRHRRRSASESNDDDIQIDRPKPDPPARRSYREPRRQLL